MKRGKAFEIIVKNFLIGIGFLEVCSDKLYIYDGPAGQMIQGLGNAHNADVLLEPMVQTPFYTPTRLLIECKDYDKKKVGLDVVRGVLGLREDINHFEIVDTNILQERRKQNRNVINNYSYIRYTYQLAVASTSGFTACAQEFAATHRISLIEFDKLPFWNESGRIVFKNNQGIKNINKAAVSGLKPQYTYTGKGITPSVTVSVDGITLKKDTDYSLSYKNNKNVGTATISIKGKGKYTGTKNLTFTIVKIILQNQTIKVNSSFLKSYSANGTFKLNATAKGKLSYKSSNTKVVTVSSKGVVTIKGTGNAVITVKAGKVLNKYNAASKNVKIKIVLKNKNMYVQPYKGVSLKSKASLTGKKVTAIPYAGAVEVKSYSNGWAYVTYKGKKGYIQEKNLGDVKPVPASSDKLLTQYSNQMSYRLVDFTKKFSKNAYRSNVTATSTEQLKKLGNMINVYASSQIIEKDKKEILEAFADAVLQAILNSNINKYETNQKKMLDQISSQIKGGLKSGSKKVTVSSGKTYTVDFNIAAQSYGGIGATVSWAYVTYGSQRYTLVISSTSEQIDAVLASYCTALAQLNTDCWKDFMSAYITGGWKLSGLNANYKLTDQKVRTYLDRSELLIRAIAGDEKAKTKLLESGSKDMKDKLKDMSNSAFRKYIKEHIKNGDKILKAADKYKKLSSKYKDWKNKYNTWKKSGKGTDLEKAEAACDQFKEILEELNLAISSM